MLASKHRFQGRNDLALTYRKGRVVRQQYMQLRFLSKQTASFRLAVVVSKKVHKSAVVRNRIRRRVYEIARRTLREDNGADLIVSVFDVRLAILPAAELEKIVVKLFRAARLELKTNDGRDIVKAEV